MSGSFGREEINMEVRRAADDKAQEGGQMHQRYWCLGDEIATPWSPNCAAEQDSSISAELPNSERDPETDTILSIRIISDAARTAGTRQESFSWRRVTPAMCVLGMVAARGVAASDPKQVARALGSQSFPDCPYIIPTQEEAFARGRDPSVPGNALWVEEIRFGRMGNRVLALSNVFNLGICCKSKMVSLPPKSDVMAPGIFNEGTPGPRWFDFSSAPDVQGFDASACPANMTWYGADAFYLSGVDDEHHPDYTPGLRDCITTLPRQIGCEAAHYFPVGVDVCQSDETGSSGEGGKVEGEPRIELETREQDENAQEWNGKRGARAVGGGTLALHVRSGDIFVQPVHHSYGQPPLQYYLRALDEQKWDRVDVLTNGLVDSTHRINPVVPALESKVAEGELVGNIHLHKNRTMAEDLVSMLCADGLVMARSSLAKAWAYHTAATRIYFPLSCSGYLQDLVDQRPEKKVYGMVMPRQDDYSPYHDWNLTEHQLHQMVTFNVTGFEECQSTFDSAA